jgi:hypothetical protein
MIDGADAFGHTHQDACNPIVKLFVRDGTPHGFCFFPNMLQAEEDAYGTTSRFLARHLTGG